MIQSHLIGHLWVMPRSQLTILKIKNKWKESSTYPASPVRTILWYTQRVNERMLIFIEV